MKRFLQLLALPVLTAFLAVHISVPVGAGDKVTMRPTVVELFTSQSCYSCPPAEQFLGELVMRNGLIALEYHVDYWDDLVYGSAGKWKDPFSSPAHTARQRGYAGSIPGGQTYTPQMVIDGRIETVGSRRNSVMSAIREAGGGDAHRVAVAAEPLGEGGLAVHVAKGDAAKAKIWLVEFSVAEMTRVRAGENKGKSLTNHHIVHTVSAIGDWSGDAVTVEMPSHALGENQGCAILVQDDRFGPILGAAMCPPAPTT